MPEGNCEATLPPQTGPSALQSPQLCSSPTSLTKLWVCPGLVFFYPLQSFSFIIIMIIFSLLLLLPLLRSAEHFFTAVLETHYASSEEDVDALIERRWERCAEARRATQRKQSHISTSRRRCRFSRKVKMSLLDFLQSGRREGSLPGRGVVLPRPSFRKAALATPCILNTSVRWQSIFCSSAAAWLKNFRVSFFLQPESSISKVDNQQLIGGLKSSAGTVAH